MTATDTAPAPTLSLIRILICGSLLVTLSMGIRHGFGLFNLPITQAHGWSRETFAFAIALQNLTWGLMQPIAGALADRHGALRVMLVGAVLYALGLVVMALAESGLAFATGAGLMIGMAQAGTTYSIVYGVIGRNVAPEKRIWAMGVTAAAGSFGQFLMIPTTQGLLSGLGWQDALLVLGVMACALLPMARALGEPPRPATAAGAQSVREAVAEAFGNRDFRLLMLGYFVCGFQVVFIGVHLAAYLKDKSAVFPEVGAPVVATVALALIGLFNVFGTYGAGWLGQRYPRKYLLSSIYFARAVVIGIFMLLPLSAVSTWIFAGVMGLLWLSTVPLTNAVIAQIFGVRYLSMLSGFVFLAHQIGSFLGVWLGGVLFDRTGSYSLVWGITIALGVFAGLINLPIRETALVRAPQPA